MTREHPWRLIDADDLPYHQHPLPFEIPASSDSHFNDGYYFAALHEDWYVVFGLRLHPNNNVIDGFAATVHGSEQRTLRASRALRPRVGELTAGPLRLQLLTPMQVQRVVVEPNESGIELDLTFTAAAEPFLEQPHVEYRHGRLVSDVLRYDQVCRVQGFVSIDGEPTTVTGWHGIRDHSWGIRSSFGPHTPVQGVEPQRSHFERRAMRIWLPFLVEGEAGYLSLHEDSEGALLDLEGRLDLADGSSVGIRDLHHRIEYEPGTRWPARGDLIFLDERGREHPYTFERVAGPCFGQAFGYARGWRDGQPPGVYRGADVLETDRIRISSKEPLAGPEHVPEKRRIGANEFPIRLTSAGGGIGMGNLEHLFFGPYHPAGFQ